MVLRAPPDEPVAIFKGHCPGAKEIPDPRELLPVLRGFPSGSDEKEVASQCKRLGFNPSPLPWRREWQPTPVFLPGKWQGQRSQAGYSPGFAESDMTEQLTFSVGTWPATEVCWPEWGLWRPDEDGSHSSLAHCGSVGTKRPRHVSGMRHHLLPPHWCLGLKGRLPYR